MSGRHEDLDGDGIADAAEQERLEAEDRLSSVAPFRAHAASALTGATVRAALSAVGAVGKQIVSFDELAAGAAGALAQAPAGLTPAGCAAFLATCAVESAWFRTTTEYGSGQRYAPYIGRTFVQLTWRENYAGFGRWCKNHGLVDDIDTFVKNPASLSGLRWAWLGPVYYFEVHGLWRYANADNFLAVSQAVNGGDGRIGTSFVPNSWAERKAMHRVFLAANIAPPAQEDDMPSIPEIGQGIWGWPIDDPYTPQGGDSMPAFAALSWATANAAHARDAAADAQATARRVEQKLDQIIAVLGAQQKP